MTPLRKRVAERLVQAQSTAAILTTFNEVDMGEVMALRKQYNEKFQAKHGVKLGFMSFFVRAAIEALKAFPQINAEIDGEDVVFKHYYDIGVAVSGSRGLVVPVVRDADTLSLAELEKRIGDFGVRARNDKLTLADLQGGTFTISNGGIFGSMLSTPILNPPQIGHPGHAQHRRPAGGAGRPDRHPADDVPGALVRSPAGGRPRGGAVPRPHQGVHRGPRAPAARGVRHANASSCEIRALVWTCTRQLH